MRRLTLIFFILWLIKKKKKWKEFLITAFWNRLFFSKYKCSLTSSSSFWKKKKLKNKNTLHSISPEMKVILESTFLFLFLNLFQEEKRRRRSIRRKNFSFDLVLKLIANKIPSSGHLTLYLKSSIFCFKGNFDI